MEVFFEFLFEIYLELMLLIVPKEKASKFKWLVIVMAIVVLLGTIVLFIWGIAFFEDKKLTGLLPIGIAVILSVAQIFAGFVLDSKKENNKD